MLPLVLDERQESNFIVLSKAVARAHSRLFPEEPYKDPRTLQVIALALTELVPMYWRESRRELTEPELIAERFNQAGLERLLVSKIRFEAALNTMQVASVDNQARASLIMRHSPRGFSARR